MRRRCRIFDGQRRVARAQKPNSGSRLRKRAEIDGLRAVAVMLVILFHAGFEAFSGGFVGIDIFLVISGYLITTIIITDLRAENFSLGNFYERRARRILPALFFVILVSLPFAWFYLLPKDIEAFGKSLVAVSTFTSNFLFWSEAGYFDTAAEFKPLLHTWSLAVEEQYYILFPLFLMLFWRFGTRFLLIACALLGIASLVVAHIGAYTLPAANYYLLPTRGWELLLGVFAAFYLAGRESSGFSRLANQALSLAGAALILVATFAFDSETPFPSLYALAPTVGALLIILAAREGTIVWLVLSNRVLVGIGLISYSAYLWHFPLFVFARHRILGEPEPWLMAVLCVVTIPLAYLSWRFIEKPFRDKSQTNRVQIVGLGATLAVGFIALGLFGAMSGGFPERGDNPLLTADLSTPLTFALTDDAGELCYDRGRDFCVFRNDEDAAWVQIVGDSHAATLAPDLVARLRPHVNLASLTNSQCWPMIGFKKHSRFGVPDLDCTPEIQQQRLDALLARENSIIVIAGRLPVYLTGQCLNNQEGGQEEDNFLLTRSLTDKTVKEGVRDYIDLLLAAGHRVLLVYPIPEVGFDVPRRVFQLTMLGDWQAGKTMLTTRSDVFHERNADAFALLDAVDHPGVVRVYPHELFCDNQVAEKCIVNDGGNVFYHDDDHPSSAGAVLINTRIVEKIEDMLTTD